MGRTRRAPIVSGVGAGALGLAGVASTAGYPVYRPKLIITDVQFSEMIPLTFERKWRRARC
jgi:hypothetical protein